MVDKWFSVNTGCGTKTCFTKRDIPNFAFNSWKKQAPKCVGGPSNNKCTFSCQDCTQSVGCSGQRCPGLSPDRHYYKLGPLKERKTGGSMMYQPYTFPLPLDYGPWPPINTNLITWARVP